MSETERGRALVVEDEAGIGRALMLLLRRRRVAAVICPTVAEAMAYIESGETFDWVLLDLMLPDGDGETVFERLRAERHPATVVVMTGIGDEQRLESVRAMNPQAVLRKPFDFDAVMQCIGLDGVA